MPHSLAHIVMKLSSIIIVFSVLARERSLKMYLISKTVRFARLFFVLCFFGLIMYATLAFYTFHIALTAVTKTNMLQYKLKSYPVPEVLIDLDTIPLKYILLWTTSHFKINLTAEGEKMFIDNDCNHFNCYLTTNKTLLGNVTKFDAIVYSISILNKWKRNFPKHRSPKQKYVLFATLPANDYPICNVKADNYFNWTWTYKLHSDISTPFIEVKDLNGNIIAPSLTVEWQENINNTIDSRNPNKRKAVMWYNQDCDNENATTFAKSLKIRLPDHSMEMDIFGCGKEKCPAKGCESVIENYFFYLVIESISDDYVTKEVLKGYLHDTVPVLIGGADYGRFLPPGSYIDARNDSPEKLASLLGYIANNPVTYNKYFSWKKHYTINEANLQKGYCQLCDLLNVRKRTETHSSYETLRKWWYYGSLQQKCYPKGAESFDALLSYIDNPALRRSYIP